MTGLAITGGNNGLGSSSVGAESEDALLTTEGMRECEVELPETIWSEEEEIAKDDSAADAGRG